MALETDRSTSQKYELRKFFASGGMKDEVGKSLYFAKIATARQVDRRYRIAADTAAATGTCVSAGSRNGQAGSLCSPD